MRSLNTTPERIPWWRSDWAVGTAVGLAGTAAVGLTISWLRNRSADCSEVGAGEGVVAGIRYLERMRGGASPDERLPMVVLFHSRSATPEGHAGMLGGIGRARLILPQGPLPGKGAGYKWWDRGVVAAMKPANLESSTKEWGTTAAQMEEFLRQIAICRPTLGRPIVTGSSQGGEMALLMASSAPRRVDSGVAVSSYLLPEFWNQGMAPSSMIHGTGDTTVPFSWAEDYALRLGRDGAPLSFSAFPSTGHAVTKEMGRSWIRGIKGRVSHLWDAAA